MSFFTRRRVVVYSLVCCAAATALIGASARGEAASSSATADSASDPGPHDWASPAEAARFADDSLRGESGKLLARFVVSTRRTRESAAFTTLFGDSSLRRPGVYALDSSVARRPFTFIALHPFAEKQGGSLGGYHIGYWPAEERHIFSATYANPSGFIEVTPENQDTRVSEHFKLRDFLTHDQRNVWPKYLVLREALVDKLELVIAELNREGIPVHHMAVMSGFRTPQYNAHGGITSGRAGMSRHMYGDASDVFVDNDYDGRMDDLNHDGRIDYRDAQIILAAEERVEAEHPDLVGGGGVYKGTSEHGPFSHIDVRGTRARWGLVK